jgi:hypothetical protein
MNGSMRATGLECIECGTNTSFDNPAIICSECGNVLDVLYDLN